MNLRISLALVLSSSVAVGCFQTIDNGVINGGPLDSTAGEGGAVPIGPLVDAGIPSAFGKIDTTQQCEAGSALCFQLCDSPECATADDAGNIVLPPVLQTPAFLLADGGQSTDPCVQLEANSMRIRTNGCAQCHSTTGAKSFWTWVLDDQQLVSNSSAPGLTPPSPLVVAGNPAASILYQKMLEGIAGAQSGMPLSPSQAASIIADAAATIVYPTPEDISTMYAWILGCAPGADAGAFQASYGGGNYGPPGGSTTSATPTKVDGGN